MESNTDTIVAVITGDIIKSQKLEATDYEKMLYTLESTIRTLISKSKSSFDIFRGDSFQIIFQKSIDAIKAAIIIRLALKTAKPSFDARQSIGIGGVMSLRNDVKSSIGEAFVLSGRGLDKMKGKFISITSGNAGLQSKVELLTKFLDAIISNLTLNQAEVLLCYLTSEDKSHSTIASLTGKNRSNVTKLLNASHYQLIDEYLNHMANYITEEYGS